MNIEKIFPESERKKIKDAIAKVEAKTSGEIVPMVVTTSDDYFWIHWLAFVLGIIVGGVLFSFLEMNSPWPQQWYYVFAWQSFFAFLFSALSFFSAVLRFLVPKKTMQKEVHRAAHAEFLAQGLTSTTHHTGILIYISLLERCVCIIGDHGIHTKVPDTYWDQQVKIISLGMREGRAADALVEAIQSMGEALVKHFPADGGGKSELSNELRIGH